jgi:hypothetical protein
MARNLPNTKAYKKLKEQVQGIFDLSVVTCYGIPALKRQMTLVEKGEIDKLPRPDYYPDEKNSIEQLRKQAIGYKSKLARFTFLSSFSFFEAFVFDAITEMIEFHGGLEHFENKNQETILLDSVVINKSKQVLRSKDKRKNDRFKRHSEFLIQNGYRFPSSLISGIGIKLLIEKLNSLKAVDIPELLKDGLHVPLTEQEIEDYQNLRGIRNNIAHGELTNFSLKKAAEMNDILRKIAYKIDKHLNEHFLINENFA